MKSPKEDVDRLLSIALDSSVNIHLRCRAYGRAVKLLAGMNPQEAIRSDQWSTQTSSSSSGRRTRAASPRARRSRRGGTSARMSH